jgi:hypothetical protein
LYSAAVTIAEHIRNVYFTGKEEVMRICLALILFSLSSCIDSANAPAIPTRPKGVPEKAFWKGGVDGGNWYVIESVNAHKNSATMSVYNGQDGSLMVWGKFMLVCPVDSMQPIKNLQEEISGFDGEKIYLEYHAIYNRKHCLVSSSLTYERLEAFCTKAIKSLRLLLLHRLARIAHEEFFRHLY